MRELLISVIVPVYKAELYIEKCIDSILSQTYKNLEIILVDDSSPDNSGKICDEYAKKDSRIKVIHKQNEGPGGARNTGLDAAKGEYIAFVDSDDYIDKNMYEDLMSIAQKEEADIVICGVYNVTNRGIKLFEKNLNDLNTKEIKQKFLMNAYPSWFFNRIHKACVFKDTKFPLNPMYYEDMFIMPTILLNVNKIVYTHATYYYYNRTNQNSLTSMPINAKEKHDFFVACAEHERVANLIKDHDAYKISQLKAIIHAIQSLCINMAKSSLMNFEIEECKKYLTNKQNNEIVVNIGLKYKFLWWCLNNLLLPCKVFGQFTILRYNIKNKKREK